MDQARRRRASAHAPSDASRGTRRASEGGSTAWDANTAGWYAGVHENGLRFGVHLRELRDPEAAVGGVLESALQRVQDELAARHGNLFRLRRHGRQNEERRQRWDALMGVGRLPGLPAGSSVHETRDVIRVTRTGREGTKIAMSQFAERCPGSSLSRLT